MKKNYLIAVEGIDGAGKSTQIPKIAQYFEARGCTVCLTAEPTKGPFGQRIRAAQTRLDPRTERQLFVDDRKEHLVTCILPALERGEVVITDRYFYSSVAYQGTRRDALKNSEDIEALHDLQDDIAEQNRLYSPEADILIYLRLDVDTALERMRSGREALDPFEKKQTLQDVSDAFDRLVKDHPQALVVDASLMPDEVTAQIYAGLDRITGE
ncbi:MAG: dTMP kinase [Proteobacteria bacterium]|nr:dTMP kinase [Pseudomonadota bacterium]MBQ9242315.1 dTMP kinase [Pseudomonadota bacterium]